MIATIVLCSLLSLARGYSIQVYGDVFRDVEFFTTTLPWIIDNIGGEISVEFYLVGSGRYSVHQMCALKELGGNSYLQAQYLKCEAEGNPSAYCLCETGIEAQRYTECVHMGGHLASLAASRFTSLNIGTTPLIELGPRNTVFGVTANWYLKKICTIFGEHPPMGCVKHFECCRNQTDTFVDKKPVAQFEKECQRGCPDINYITTTSTTPLYSYETEPAYIGR